MAPNACFAAHCAPIGSCLSDCGCSGGAKCTSGQCQIPAGMLCGPCGNECTTALGVCRDNFCATRCDDTKLFCPRGFRCDNPNMAKYGACVPSLTTGCTGCGSDGDCPMGEVCNPNNRRCIAPPVGPDARLEMEQIQFVADDGMGNKSVATELQWSTGFYTYPDPSFDPYALAPGTCGSLRSTLDENAPYPLGPGRDAGDILVLNLPSSIKDFTRTPVADPNVVLEYDASAIQVSDWVPGTVSWMGPGGKDVGPFMLSGVAPSPYTTMPDVLGMTPLAADTTKGLTVAFTAPVEKGVRTILEVSWNDINGNMVTALTQIACRGMDGDTSVTVPGNLLMQTPRGQELSALLIRASVVPIQASGVKQGEAIFGTQQLGSVIVAP
jgi:hypothetical protein